MAPLPNYRCPILLRTAENSRVRALVFVAAHESVCTFRTCRPPLTNVGYQGKSGSNSDIAKSTRLTQSRYSHIRTVCVGRNVAHNLGPIFNGTRRSPLPSWSEVYVFHCRRV